MVKTDESASFEFCVEETNEYVNEKDMILSDVSCATPSPAKKSKNTICDFLDESKLTSLLATSRADIPNDCSHFPLSFSVFSDTTTTHILLGPLSGPKSHNPTADTMMKAFFALLLAAQATAFTPRLGVKVPLPSLSASAAVTYDSLMKEAKEVAFDRTASPDEARRLLFEVLHVQSGCASGELMGEEICENVTEIAEIVAHLRDRCHHQPISRSVSSALFNSLLFSSFCLLSIVATQTLTDSVDTSPFTLQEWQWAFHDDYLASMIRENLKYGGFALTEGDAHSDVMQLQLQEIIWSVRDGYFGTLVSHFVKNGGL